MDPCPYKSNRAPTFDGCRPGTFVHAGIYVTELRPATTDIAHERSRFGRRLGIRAVVSPIAYPLAELQTGAT